MLRKGGGARGAARLVMPKNMQIAAVAAAAWPHGVATLEMHAASCEKRALYPPLPSRCLPYCCGALQIIYLSILL